MGGVQRTTSRSNDSDGETPEGVQSRIVSALARLAAAHVHATIAIVSHADVLRSALLRYAKRSLNEYSAFEIEPASVSAIYLSPHDLRVSFVNDGRFAGRDGWQRLGG
jgi:broad specificity phosphatase PhoE